jgi:Na+/H+-dicarboxylate symporter
MRNKRGQSILEYVIVLTVVVAAIAFGAARFLQPAVQQGTTDASASVNDATRRLPGTGG